MKRCVHKGSFVLVRENWMLLFCYNYKITRSIYQLNPFAIVGLDSFFVFTGRRDFLKVLSVVIKKESEKIFLSARFRIFKQNLQYGLLLLYLYMMLTF